jgi:hypothetical protein
MRPTFLRRLAATTIILAASALIAGCPDSPHLYLPGAGAAVDGGESACVSNAACTYPASVCDVTRAMCVECLTFDDCKSRPGTVCSSGRCACLDPAASFCPGIAGQKDRCIDVQITSADCGACGHTCLGTCVAGTCADGWEAVSAFNAPEARSKHVAVWDPAAKVMVVWGGIHGSKALGSGGLYTLSANRWAPVSTLNAPEPRHSATVVWDDMDEAMIVWGGITNGADGWVNSGGIFYPGKNTWEALPTSGAPSPRAGHVAVWDSLHKMMIVWGGGDKNRLDNGGVFDMAKKQWAPLAAGPLLRRSESVAVFDGTSMLVWGGIGFNGDMNNDALRNDGASWSAIAGWKGLPWSPLGARQLATAVWTGTSMIVWGGQEDKGTRNDGAMFKDAKWTQTNADRVIGGRHSHSAVWLPATGEMIIWGGDSGNGLLNDGARLKAAGLTWAPIPAALSPRRDHTAVIAGSKMIVWGGDSGNGGTSDGGIFELSSSPSPP